MMSEPIIVECGARRQKFRVESNLKSRVCEYFDIKSEIVSFEMFNYARNQYETIENFERIENLRPLHRFRLVKHVEVNVKFR